MTAPAVQSEGKLDAGPVGIWGWLIFPVIGIVVTPVRGFPLIGKYAAVARMLPSLDRLHAGFFIAEAVAELLFVAILPLALLILLFLRKRLFPNIFIGWAIGSLIWQVLDVMLVSVIFELEFAQRGMPFFDAEMISEFARGFFTAAVWAPYMAFARRVKNTFVK